MRRGRKPGYKHCEETREKMRQFHRGKSQSDSTKEKISRSMSGKSKSPAHRAALSKSALDIDRKCMLRFLELCDDYPDHQGFLYQNQEKLLIAMRTIKSEAELRYIRKYIENVTLEGAPSVCTSYQYESSSCYAQEDATIDLLDAVAFLRRVFGTKDVSLLTH